MIDLSPLPHFMRSESGAITVDWTVLSAAAVAMCLGTAGAMTDIFGLLSGQMDSELRDRQMGDEWLEYYASHFQSSLDTGYITEDQAEVLYNMAEGMSSNTIMERLADGIYDLENGNMTTEELMELIAIASVADQLNLADDAMLDYYFGFDGSDPYYMTTAAAPNESDPDYSQVACDGSTCTYGGGNGT